MLGHRRQQHRRRAASGPAGWSIDWVFAPLETSFTDVLLLTAVAMIQKSTDHRFILATATLPPDLDVDAAREVPARPTP